MTKTLEELIERSFDLRVNLQLSTYELHQYEDGSYSDFHVRKILDLPTLVKLAGGLELNFIADDGFIIVRLYERDSIWD